ncbi:MAG: hypothetical protein M1831_003585 [Alyxoria varia]|nr:MAG: hypothetical protein M1831_003585 [Alyxoria varia]
MDKFTDSSSDGQSAFKPQNATAEDLLKSHTVGLPAKKRKKAVAKGKLSFGLDEADEESTPIDSAKAAAGDLQASSDLRRTKPRLGPSTAISHAPKVVTKSTLTKEAQTRSQLRREFMIIQEALKSTEILIPFVFYDGTNIPGGFCKVKKGDHIWFFLDKARKVGAQMGVGGDRSKKEWARVGVDDLMLVRGEIIIPHHYDIYYFIINGVQGFEGDLFDFSAQPSQRAIASIKKNLEDTDSFDPLTNPGQKDKPHSSRDSGSEGADQDPAITKVVDRRWYERNKHIYPASMWQEFEPGTDYKKSIRKDTVGNAFFFS